MYWRCRSRRLQKPFLVHLLFNIKHVSVKRKRTKRKTKYGKTKIKTLLENNTFEKCLSLNSSTLSSFQLWGRPVTTPDYFTSAFSHFCVCTAIYSPGGGEESSESVSLSLLSSTWKLGKFQDMLTMPSDSCKRMWASMRPWQSITMTCPSAVPNSTCRGQKAREEVVREGKTADPRTEKPSHSLNYTWDILLFCISQEF